MKYAIVQQAIDGVNWEYTDFSEMELSEAVEISKLLDEEFEDYWHKIVPIQPQYTIQFYDRVQRVYRRMGSTNLSLEEALQLAKSLNRRYPEISHEVVKLDKVEVLC